MSGRSSRADEGEDMAHAISTAAAAAAAAAGDERWRQRFDDMIGGGDMLLLASPIIKKHHPFDSDNRFDPIAFHPSDSHIENNLYSIAFVLPRIDPSTAATAE